MNRTKALKTFAMIVLDRLEQDLEWTPGTLDAISALARDLELAKTDKNGMFRKTKEPQARKTTKKGS